MRTIKPKRDRQGLLPLDQLHSIPQQLPDEDKPEIMKSASKEEKEVQERRNVEELEQIGLTLDHLAAMVRIAKDRQWEAQD